MARNPFSFNDEDPSLTDSAGSLDQVGRRRRRRKGGGGGNNHRHRHRGGGMGGAGAPNTPGNDAGGSDSLGNQGSGGPFDSGYPGNITSGLGGFQAEEHPDAYWSWAMSKAGLNQDKTRPFGSWLWDQFNLFNQMEQGAKLDNPAIQFPNYLGGLLGVGSPTPPNPTTTLHDANGDGLPDNPGGAGDGAGGGGNNQRRRRHRQDNHDDHDRHRKKGRH